jgi:prophage antirepressor-like protein
MTIFHNQQNREFNSHSISLISYHNTGWFSGHDIGKCLEYKKPRKSIHDIYRRNIKLLTKYSTVRKLPTVDGKCRQIRLYNEEGVMIIAMRSRQPKADEFCEWAAL